MGYIYLVISTILNAVFALGYKAASHNGCRPRSVNLWLYVGAASVLVVNFIVTGHKYHPTAAALGFITGIGVFISTLAFFYHMRTGLIAVSWTVIGLAVAFPVAASILIWHETPTPKQWIGLALIPAAFVLCGIGPRRADSQ